MPKRPALLVALLLTALPALAETPLAPVTVTNWKAVYGRIETRDRIPARARIGGILTELTAAEGDLVQAGQQLALIVDDKIGFQLSAIDAQLDALSAQSANALAELKRGEQLQKDGVITTQRLEALQTAVDVVASNIAANRAQRQVLVQQSAEGAILAPVSGRVLDVPLAVGAVVMPGEPVASLGGGGFFLRLAVPERHAANLNAGDEIMIETVDGEKSGKLAKVYPLIENGRVLADVEVPDLSEDFVDARVLVRLPVGTRSALLVPPAAVRAHSGLDFVATQGAAGLVERAVVLGPRHVVEGVEMVEVISGLAAGDVVVDHE